MINPLVYILVLNYRGLKDTIECVESLKKINYDNYRIVIIDNNSDDGSEDVLRHQYADENIDIVQTGENLGYAKANNIGIRMAIESNAKYTCILNNDVVVSKEFLTELVNGMERQRRIAIAGPLILDYYEGKIQSAGARINFAKGECSFNYCSKEVEDVEYDEISCDYVEGACILVRNDLIAEIGFIPDDYFLFYEETEWCCNARKNGYIVICNTKSIIKHKGSVSMHNIGEFQFYFLNRNRVMFIKRNASLQQKLFFFFYLFAQTVYRICIKGDSIKLIGHYIDGLDNRNRWEKNDV